MTSEEDKYWKTIVGRLRRAQGMCPLSLRRKLKLFTNRPPTCHLRPRRFERMSEAVMNGELLDWNDPEDKPWDESAYENASEESLQIFRNEGEQETEAQQRERDLEDKLLNDDEPEEDV